MKSRPNRNSQPLKKYQEDFDKLAFVKRYSKQDILNFVEAKENTYYKCYEKEIGRGLRILRESYNLSTSNQAAVIIAGEYAESVAEAINKLFMAYIQLTNQMYLLLINSGERIDDVVKAFNSARIANIKEIVSIPLFCELDTAIDITLMVAAHGFNSEYLQFILAHSNNIPKECLLELISKSENKVHSNLISALIKDGHPIDSHILNIIFKPKQYSQKEVIEKLNYLLRNNTPHIDQLAAIFFPNDTLPEIKAKLIFDILKFGSTTIDNALMYNLYQSSTSQLKIIYAFSQLLPNNLLTMTQIYFINANETIFNHLINAKFPLCLTMLNHRFITCDITQYLNEKEKHGDRLTPDMLGVALGIRSDYVGDFFTAITQLNEVINLNDEFMLTIYDVLFADLCDGGRNHFDDYYQCMRSSDEFDAARRKYFQFSERIENLGKASKVLRAFNALTPLLTKEDMKAIISNAKFFEKLIDANIPLSSLLLKPNYLYFSLNCSEHLIAAKIKYGDILTAEMYANATNVTSTFIDTYFQIVSNLSNEMPLTAKILEAISRAWYVDYSGPTSFYANFMEQLSDIFLKLYLTGIDITPEIASKFIQSYKRNTHTKLQHICDDILNQYYKESILKQHQMLLSRFPNQNTAIVRITSPSLLDTLESMMRPLLCHDVIMITFLYLHSANFFKAVNSIKKVLISYSEEKGVLIQELPTLISNKCAETNVEEQKTTQPSISPNSSPSRLIQLAQTACTSSSALELKPHEASWSEIDNDKKDSSPPSPR